MSFIYFVTVLTFRGMRHNVPALGEVVNFGTDYFLSKIKFLAKCKRVFTAKFAILPNACCAFGFILLISSLLDYHNIFHFA
jgi:hypothetical protein